MNKDYDPGSFHTLRAWVQQNEEELVSNRQVAVITCDSGYVSRLYRQHVSETASGTLLIEDALRYLPGNPKYKVYFNALEASSGHVRRRPLDRHQSGHYVYEHEVKSVPWLSTSSLWPY